MVLRLDPSVPLVWRTPRSMQFGLDRPVAVVNEVTTADERMIAALTVGVSRDGLALVARAAGATPVDADRLLVSLGSAVITHSPVPLEATVVIAGSGSTARRLGDAVQSAGVRVRMAGADLEHETVAADLAIIVAHFVIAPRFYGLWLRRDQPHLPVVLTDSGARIGPIVEPGRGPCLYCLERFRTDADSAWPAIASQLWGRRSVHDTGLVAGETAAIAARMTLDRLRSGVASSPTSVRLEAASGIRSRRTWRPHPECGCVALPGNGMANAVPIGSARSRTTTVPVGSAPG